MVPLYILGLLIRFGPQHGYQIKKIIGEQLSDFTQIKLPTIYYHLDKMYSEKLLGSENEKESSRPEKTVYSITEKGRTYFRENLNKLLRFEYRPVFSSDSVFYFSDSLDKDMIISSLKSYLNNLETILKIISQHKEETMKFVPEENRKETEIIFQHHMLHYKAELSWATDAINILK